MSMIDIRSFNLSRSLPTSSFKWLERLKFSLRKWDDNYSLFSCNICKAYTIRHAFCHAWLVLCILKGLCQLCCKKHMPLKNNLPISLKFCYMWRQYMFRAHVRRILVALFLLSTKNIEILHIAMVHMLLNLFFLSCEAYDTIIIRVSFDPYNTIIYHALHGSSHGTLEWHRMRPTTLIGSICFIFLIISFVVKTWQY